MGNGRVRIKKAGKAANVLEALQAQGEYLLAPCGGNGTCGKCRVKFLPGNAREAAQIPPASAADRKVLTEQEISAGIRLACTAAAAGTEGMEIEILSQDESDIEAAVSFSLDRPGAGSSPGGGKASQTKALQRDSSHDSKKNLPQEDLPTAGLPDAGAGAEADAGSDRLTAAVDIGTTTIAMSAVDPGTGRVHGTVTGINHQRTFGADVISRIEASNQGKGDQLRQSILNDLAALRTRLGLPEDVPMVISGNTTMEHLLQGLPCRTLGVSPYTPVDISLHTCGNMTILPGISTFVGADIVSGIVACGMDRSEEICILVDLGTNGEMAIGNRDRIISASTAAGPAFEGGNISCGVAGIPGAVSGVEIRNGEAHVQTIGGRPPAGLCGTGVLEAVYELLKEELIDETGLLDEDYFESGFPLADGITFTAKDVREVQLAKSAVRAGLEVLLQEYGADYSQIGKLYIAGGFGQKINFEKAVGIGLLPEELLDRMMAVGNSSLAGAVMAAHDPATLERMRAVGEKAEETALAENPLFSDLYMDNMFFPELSSDLSSDDED